MSKRNAVQNSNANRKQKQKQKPKRPNSRRNNRARQNLPMDKNRFITDCAKDYLQALTDPFGYSGNMSPCVPDLIDLPSYKFSTLSTGTFTVGTANVGYVAVTPSNFTNDVPIGVTTSAAFAGSTVSQTAAGTAGFNNIRFPYTNASQREVRLVAMGLRCRYMGSELNRSGRIICAVTAAGSDALNGSTIVGLMSRPDTSSFACDRGWHGVNWKPLLPSDTQYGTRNNDATSATLNTVQLLCLADGTIAAQSFEFQLVAYFEAIPRFDSPSGNTLSVPNVSKSHSDTVGMSNIRDYLGSIKSTEQGPSVFQKGLAFIRNLAIGAISAYSPIAGGFVRAITN